MGLEKRFFTLFEVCEIIGASRRQIQYWGSTGLISPEVRTQGGHARYSFRNLIAYKAAKKLIDAGVSVQRLRKSLATLQNFLPKVKSPLQELTLVASGDIVLVLYENTLFEAITGQGWIMHLADLQRDVEQWYGRSQRIKRLKRKRSLQKAGSPLKKVVEGGHGPGLKDSDKKIFRTP